MSAVPPDAGASHARGLTHVEERGKAHMVDVTGKEATYRIAEARCFVQTVASVDQLLSLTPKGSDLLASARFAGIMAAKQTSALIPLCHPIRVNGIDVNVRSRPNGFAVAAVVAIIEKTGVEMEALTACTTAALVLVRAVWAFDPLASIEDLTLWHKSGGRSGRWERGPMGDRGSSPSTRSL
jgi:cyclic pyranopterin monophosphate synthase